MSLAGTYACTKKNYPATLQGTYSVAGQCDNGERQYITERNYLSASVLSSRPKRSTILDEVCARSVSLAASEAL